MIRLNNEVLKRASSGGSQNEALTAARGFFSEGDTPDFERTEVGAFLCHTPRYSAFHARLAEDLLSISSVVVHDQSPYFQIKGDSTWRELRNGGLR